jgi:hypothetical protein
MYIVISLRLLKLVVQKNIGKLIHTDPDTLDFGVGHVEKICTMFHDVLMKQGIETDEFVPEWKHLQCLVYQGQYVLTCQCFSGQRVLNLFEHKHAQLTK